MKVKIAKFEYDFEENKATGYSVGFQLIDDESGQDKIVYTGAKFTDVSEDASEQEVCNFCWRKALDNGQIARVTKKLKDARIVGSEFIPPIDIDE